MVVGHVVLQYLYNFKLCMEHGPTITPKERNSSFLSFLYNPIAIIFWLPLNHD
jgi:hypothetical protein